MKLYEVKLGKDKFSCRRCSTLQVLLTKPTSGYMMDIYSRRRREVIHPPRRCKDPSILLLQCINCGSSYEYHVDELIRHSDHEQIISELKTKIKKLEKENETKTKECQILTTSLEKVTTQKKFESKESHNNESHQHYG